MLRSLRRVRLAPSALLVHSAACPAARVSHYALTHRRPHFSIGSAPPVVR